MMSVTELQKSKFTLSDAGVFAACELTALPMCDAGWHAIVSGEHIARGATAVLVGAVVGLLGASFHWWKDKIPTTLRSHLRRQAAEWWPVTLLLAVAYFAGPTIYQRVAGASDKSSDRIFWNFEQTARGAGYFLNMSKTNDQEIRILGFQAHGKNNSKTPVSHFIGYMRSDLTNARKPIYIFGQDAVESKIPACVPRIPTLPEQTYGIPGYADFDITTLDKTFVAFGSDGVTAAKFMSDFVPFTISIEYDGGKVERQFTKAEVLQQISLFENTLNQQSTPRILRKPDAAPPLASALEPIIKPAPAQSLPPLKLLIPPADNTPVGTIPSKK